MYWDVGEGDIKDYSYFIISYFKGNETILLIPNWIKWREAAPANLKCCFYFSCSFELYKIIFSWFDTKERNHGINYSHKKRNLQYVTYLKNDDDKDSISFLL